MANELTNMSNQFSGLPMDSLIGAPLKAACDAQVSLAQATADFINTVGFDEKKEVRTTTFAFKQKVPNEEGVLEEKDVEIRVPTLSIVNIPSLSVKTVDITFDMEVKSSFEENSKFAAQAETQVDARFGPVKVSVKGSVSAHKDSTRKSDNSAKYHVQVLARDDGMPEGLARVLDIMHAAVAPTTLPKAA